MEFGLVIVVGALALVGVLLLIGRFYPGSGAEQLDWRPTRSHELEVQLELDDVEQMLEAQNARRRRTGRPELSEEGITLEVQAAERERRERAARYREP